MFETSTRFAFTTFATAALAVGAVAVTVQTRPVAAQAQPAQTQPAQAGPIAAYDALLTRYVVVSPDGVNRVDYARWKASADDRKALDGVIAGKASMKPSTMTRPEQFAYWANMYNAVTLKVILDNYPVSSIRDIKSTGVWFDPRAFIGPWVAKRVTVEGKELSLEEIEHEIMRPTFKDPRVHYAVNCASYGCPNLPPKAFTGATLDADLDAGARAFVNHPRGVTVKSDGTLQVSSIYHWFKVDFGGTDAGVVAHLKQYAEPALKAKLDTITTVGGHAYDWALNDTAKAKG
jgi:hypothetical protein